MKGEKYFKKAIVMGVICLLTLSSVPLVLGDNENKSSTSVNKTFTDCKITIIGKCNTVTNLIWLFGMKTLLLKKDFTISANGQENESLTIFVRSSGDWGFYLSYEDVDIHIYDATGFLYWGAKSLLLDGQGIFARCSAKTVEILGEG